MESRTRQALEYAKLRKWRECFLMIQQGVFINYVDGNSILLYAVEQNNVKATRYLLEVYNADPNVGNENVNPLLMSIANNSYEITRLILKNGGRPISYMQKNPLLFACKSGRGRTVRLLLCYGADPNEVVQTRDGSVIIPVCTVINDHASMLRDLENYGADVRVALEAAQLLNKKNILNSFQLRLTQAY